MQTMKRSRDKGKKKEVEKEGKKERINERRTKKEEVMK